MSTSKKSPAAMTDKQLLAAAQAQIAAMTDAALLGTPTPFGKAAKAPKAPKVPKAPRVVLSTEEQKAKRNESQRVLRSTPEGKAYANAASKKSIALKKARIQAELDALKALVALLPVPAASTEEVAPVVEAPVVVVAPTSKKAPKRLPTPRKAPVDAEDAPM